jgi:hypothetical protein
MRSLRAVAALAALGLGFGAVTWYALEGKEVGVLRTRRPDGSIQETHVWVAEDEAGPVIEAATAERSWYRNLLAEPGVELRRRHGSLHRYRAVPEPGDAGHERIRALLRAKYGWADVWVGWLQDTSRSILVRLEPRD